MRDVAPEPPAPCKARAVGFIRLPPAAIVRVREGGVLEAARHAALAAVARTSELLPYCDTAAVLSADLHTSIFDEGVDLVADVEGPSGAGVDAKALTAVAVAALSLHDLLKTHATSGPPIRIGGIRLSG